MSTDFGQLSEGRKVKFDLTINLGHVLTFFGFVATIFVSYSTLDKRVVVLEEARKTQAAIDRAQDQQYSSGVSSIQVQLERIERRLDKLVDQNSLHSGRK